MTNEMLAYLEEALDNHRLFIRMSNQNMWKARRNGKTQTWKTRPGEFRIPIKAGFTVCGALTHKSTVGLPGDGIMPDVIVDAIAGGKRFNFEGPI